VRSESPGDHGTTPFERLTDSSVVQQAREARLQRDRSTSGCLRPDATTDHRRSKYNCIIAEMQRVLNLSSPSQVRVKL